MNKNKKPIIQRATWKKAAIFSALFGVFYALINFSSVGVAGLLKITGGASILDLEFGYSQEEAYQMLTALGTAGRSFYLMKISPLDFLFPFTYMLCFAGWIALLIKQVTHRDRYKYLLLIPVLTMLFDWMENVNIIVMLNGYPDLPAGAVFSASISGMLKTVFTIGNIIVMSVLFIIFSLKKMRG